MCVCMSVNVCVCVCVCVCEEMKNNTHITLFSPSFLSSASSSLANFWLGKCPSGKKGVASLGCYTFQY